MEIFMQLSNEMSVDVVKCSCQTKLYKYKIYQY